MQSCAISSSHSVKSTSHRRRAATEPVGGVIDPTPFHPDERHPDYIEQKRKKERKPPEDRDSGAPGGKRPDPEHQIDEYACPVQLRHEMIM